MGLAHLIFICWQVVGIRKAKPNAISQRASYLTASSGPSDGLFLSLRGDFFFQFFMTLRLRHFSPFFYSLSFHSHSFEFTTKRKTDPRLNWIFSSGACCFSLSLSLDRLTLSRAWLSMRPFVHRKVTTMFDRRVDGDWTRQGVTIFIVSDWFLF